MSHVRLTRVESDRSLNLEQLRIKGDFSISRCKVNDGISLDGTTVKGGLAIDGLELSGEFSANDVTTGSASIVGTQFQSSVRADNLNSDELNLENCLFDGDTQFGSLRLGKLDVKGCTFTDRASFGYSHADIGFFFKTKFERDGWFSDNTYGLLYWDKVIFGDVWDIGSITAGTFMAIDCAFERYFKLHVVSSDVNWSLMRLIEGGEISSSWSDVRITDSQFGNTTRIRAGSEGGTLSDRLGDIPYRDSDFFHMGTAMAGDPSGRAWRTPKPRIVNLAGCSVAELELDNVDLRACTFQGVKELDQLTWSSSSELSSTPTGLHRSWPPRWSARRTMVSENRWRQRNGQPGQWLSGANMAATYGTTGAEQGPGDIALIYRRLRTSLEGGNEHGLASDMYYGEMEMRRRSASSRAERAVISAYWGLSGYGTRASRAILLLIVLVFVAAVVFLELGAEATLSRQIGLGQTVLLAAKSIFTFAPSDAWELSTLAQGLQLALRIIGPLLLGAAGFALRDRIKR